MAAQITWRFIDPQTFTIDSSTWINDFLAGFNTLFTQGSPSPPDSVWEIAQYVSSTPRSLLLRRRDGSPGRIIIMGNNGTNFNTDAAQVNTAGLCIAYSQSSTSNTVDANWNSAAPLSATDYIPGVLCAANTAVTEPWNLYAAESSAGIVIAGHRLNATNIAATPSTTAWHGFAGDLVVGLDETIYPCIQGTPNGGATFVSTTLEYIASGIQATYTSPAIVVRAYGYDFPLTRSHFTVLSNQQLYWDYATNTMRFAPINLISSNFGAVGNQSFFGKLRQICYGPTALAMTRVKSVETGEVAAWGICPHVGGAAASTVSWLDAIWVVNCEV